MKVRIVAPHPHIKPHHVKHVAGAMTLAGGGLEIFAPFPHVGTCVLVIAGLIAIYEPHIIHEITVED